MEKKEEEKNNEKETVEDILAELDALLSKMPAILEGVKVQDVPQSLSADSSSPKDIPAQAELRNQETGECGNAGGSLSSFLERESAAPVKISDDSLREENMSADLRRLEMPVDDKNAPDENPRAGAEAVAENQNIVLEAEDSQKEPYPDSGQIQGVSGQDTADIPREPAEAECFVQEKSEVENQPIGTAFTGCSEGEDKTVVPQQTDAKTVMLKPEDIAQLINKGGIASQDSSEPVLSVQQSGGRQTDNISVESRSQPAVSGGADAVGYAEIFEKQPPEGFEPGQIKCVGFIYGADDAGVCADFIAMLDDVCGKSKKRPLFIKRVFVREFAQEIKGAGLVDIAAETGASGIICIGDIPDQNIRDIDKSLLGSGLLFRHISREDALARSSAVDFIVDLVLK